MILLCKYSICNSTEVISSVNSFTWVSHAPVIHPAQSSNCQQQQGEHKPSSTAASQLRRSSIEWYVHSTENPVSSWDRPYCSLCCLLARHAIWHKPSQPRFPSACMDWVLAVGHTAGNVNTHLCWRSKLTAETFLWAEIVTRPVTVSYFSGEGILAVVWPLQKTTTDSREMI